MILGGGHRVIDAELAAYRHPGAVEALTVDPPFAGILTAVAPPYDHISTIIQGRDVLLVLPTRGVGVGPELHTIGCTVGIEALAIDPCTAAVLAVRAPDHDKATVRHGGNRWLSLVTGFEASTGIDLEHRALFDRCAVEALSPDIVVSAAAFIEHGIPHGDKSATLQRCQIGHGLLVVEISGRRIVDDKLACDCCPIVAKLASDDVETGRRIDLLVASPRHREATTLQSDHLGLVLRAVSFDIDLELVAQRVVIAVVDARKHTLTASVLSTFVSPNDHVAVVRKIGDGRRTLGPRQSGVDNLLGTKRHRSIGLRRDVDRDRLGQGDTAVAVRQADRYGAARFGVGQKVLIREVFDQGLRRLGRGTGIEQHGQGLAIDTVREDGADHDGARTVAKVVGDIAARHADLLDARAFVADAQLVLRVDAWNVELVGIAIRGDVADVEPPTRKIGGVGVQYADARIDQLRGVVDQVFQVGHRAAQIDDHRGALAGIFSRDANQTLEDAGTVAIRIGIPAHDEVAVGQAHHDRLLVAGSGTVERDLAVYAVARRIELLREDVGRAVSAPSYDKTTIGQRRGRCLVLVVEVGLADSELGRRRIAAVVKQARIDTITTAVLLA